MIMLRMAGEIGVFLLAELHHIIMRHDSCTVNSFQLGPRKSHPHKTTLKLGVDKRIITRTFDLPVHSMGGGGRHGFTWAAAGAHGPIASC